MALLPRAIADKIQRMLSTDDKQSDGWKDATSGKVLEVGSFGLGVVNTTRLDDCNDTSIESINGYFVVDSNASNAPQSGSGFLWNQDWTSSAYRRQMYCGASNNAIYYRTMSAGTWGDWHEVFHQANIVGALSQSAGVPTGAIIGWGANANGYYVKFADGTMICYGLITLGGIALATAWNAMYRSSSLIYNFPATFITPPVCTGVLLWTDVVSTSASGVLNYQTTVNSSRFILIHPTAIATSGARTVHFQVIGRWF